MNQGAVSILDPAHKKKSKTTPCKVGNGDQSTDRSTISAETTRMFLICSIIEPIMKLVSDIPQIASFFMTHPQSGVATVDTAVRIALPADDLVQATGAQDHHLQIRRLRSVVNTIWLDETQEEDSSGKAIAAVLASLKKIGPLNELEGMLAAQMVATHNTAMECLRRSLLPDQSFEGRQENLRHAVKFLNLYTRQMESLDRHRDRVLNKGTMRTMQASAAGHDGEPQRVEGKPTGLIAQNSPQTLPLMDDVTGDPAPGRMVRDG